MYKRRKYRVEGILNGGKVSFAEVMAYNGQWAFRKIKRQYPDIVDMKAYRLE